MQIIQLKEDNHPFYALFVQTYGPYTQLILEELRDKVASSISIETIDLSDMEQAKELKKQFSDATKKQLIQLLKEEVNVKEIVFDKSILGELELETAVTSELREEGMLRDLVRLVQGLRQKAAYRPQDRISLAMELPKALKSVVSRNEDFLKREGGAAELEYIKTSKFEAEAETKLEGAPVWLAVRKI